MNDSDDEKLPTYQEEFANLSLAKVANIMKNLEQIAKMRRQMLELRIKKSAGWSRWNASTLTSYFRLGMWIREHLHVIPVSRRIISLKRHLAAKLREEWEARSTVELELDAKSAAIARDIGFAMATIIAAKFPKARWCVCKRKNDEFYKQPVLVYGNGIEFFPYVVGQNFSHGIVLQEDNSKVLGITLRSYLRQE